MLIPSRGQGRVGVLLPFTNVNLEADYAAISPAGISFHFSRIGGYDVDAIPDAKQMAGLGEAPLNEPLRLLAGAKPDVILYGCTSATLSHGLAFDRELAQRIKNDTGAETVTAAGALLNAMSHLGITKIGFASPYIGHVNDLAEAFFANAGVETVSRADVGVELGNYGQGELTPDQVFKLGMRADSPAAQAIVLSCTDMRGVETIERLETALGKPVITSNQAMLFAALQILGVDLDVPEGGQLFKLIRQRDDNGSQALSQRHAIISPNAPAGAGPYSQAICAGGFVFLSGIGSLDVETHEILGDSVAEQTRITMTHITHILAAHGATLDNVVKMGVYLQNSEDYEEFDAVYAEYFTKPYPARLTIGAGQVWDMFIKMDCVAYIP